MDFINKILPFAAPSNAGVQNLANKLIPAAAKNVPGITSQSLPMTQFMGDIGPWGNLLAAQPGNRMVGNDVWAKQHQFPSFGLLGQKPQMPPMPNPLVSSATPDLMAQEPQMQGNVSFQDQSGFGNNLQAAIMRLYMMRKNGLL